MPASCLKSFVDIFCFCLLGVLNGCVRKRAGIEFLIDLYYNKYGADLMLSAMPHILTAKWNLRNFSIQCGNGTLHVFTSKSVTQAKKENTPSCAPLCF